MYLPLQAANGNLHSPCCVVEVARKNPRRNISRVEAKSDAGRTYGGWEVRIQRRRRRASADVVAVLTLYSPAREKGERSAAVHAGEEDVGVTL